MRGLCNTVQLSRDDSFVFRAMQRHPGLFRIDMGLSVLKLEIPRQSRMAGHPGAMLDPTIAPSALPCHPMPKACSLEL